MTSYIKKEDLQKIIDESTAPQAKVKTLVTVDILSYLIVAILALVLILIVFPLVILLLTPLLVLSVPFIIAEYMIKVFLRKNLL